MSAAASARSRFGLHAANFFLAQITGIATPFLSDFLREQHWGYDAIGVAGSMASLGVLVMQVPASLTVERLGRPRALLAIAAIAAGVCYGLVPQFGRHPAILNLLLFASGLAQSFFAPLLAGLAIGLVEASRWNKTIGANQAWNHVGNIVAALVAMVVTVNGVSHVFYAIAAITILAGSSSLIIRREDVDHRRFLGHEGGETRARLADVIRDRRILILLATTTLFQVANTPVFPFLALRIKQLEGTERAIAAMMLVAHAAMIPVALLAGSLCERWGRKPVFAIAFLAQPVRTLSCAFVTEPGQIVALQVFGGISAGIFGVLIVSMFADLTRGTGRFNAVVGASAALLGLASIVGPVITGVLMDQLGFVPSFLFLTGLAAIPAVHFIVCMPETRPVPVLERVLHQESLP